MTTSSIRKHAGPGPTSDQPPVPEPTFAERARTLVYLGRIGSLSPVAEAARLLVRVRNALRVGRSRASHLPDQHNGHATRRTCRPTLRASLLVTQEIRRRSARSIESNANRKFLPVQTGGGRRSQRSIRVMLNLLEPERSLTLLALDGSANSECLGLRCQDVSFAEAATYVRGRGPVAQWCAESKASKARPLHPYWMTLCSAGNVGRHMLSRATGCSPHSG